MGILTEETWYYVSFAKLEVVLPGELTFRLWSLVQDVRHGSSMTGWQWSISSPRGCGLHLAHSSHDAALLLSRLVVSDSATPWTAARLLCPWDSSGKNTGVGCHALLQGIFATQGSNLGLLHCRQILYHWAIREAPIAPIAPSRFLLNFPKS